MSRERPDGDGRKRSPVDHATIAAQAEEMWSDGRFQRLTGATPRALPSIRPADPPIRSGNPATVANALPKIDSEERPTSGIRRGSQRRQFRLVGPNGELLPPGGGWLA